MEGRTQPRADQWRTASALVWGFLCQGLFSSTKLFLGSVGQL
jgi:hypothetical protein